MGFLALAGLQAADTGTRSMEGLPPREPALLAVRVEGDPTSRDAGEDEHLRLRLDLLGRHLDVGLPETLAPAIGEAARTAAAANAAVVGWLERMLLLIG